MPRAKISKGESMKTNLQQPADTWIFISKGEVFKCPEECNDKNIDIVSLRHPQSGESSFFLFPADNESIYEILTFDEEKRSWFIDEFVKSDGKMYISTPLDPLFLVIPYLQKHCATQAIPLDHLLRDDVYPATERLLKCIGLKYLNLIADRKGTEDLNAYKYNEEKTLSWLQVKTENVAKVLKKNRICGSSRGAVSATFVKASRDGESNDEVYLRYAHGIVSEYLPDELSKKLLKHLHLPEVDEFQNNTKRKSSALLAPEQKKVKLENGNSVVASSESSTVKMKSPKTVVTTTKGRARAKAASGNKTISSFFKKK